VANQKGVGSCPFCGCRKFEERRKKGRWREEGGGGESSLFYYFHWIKKRGKDERSYFIRRGKGVGGKMRAKTSLPEKEGGEGFPPNPLRSGVRMKEKLAGGNAAFALLEKRRRKGCSSEIFSTGRRELHVPGKGRQISSLRKKGGGKRDDNLLEFLGQAGEIQERKRRRVVPLDGGKKKVGSFRREERGGKRMRKEGGEVSSPIQERRGGKGGMVYFELSGRGRRRRNLPLMGKKRKNRGSVMPRDPRDDPLCGSM